MQIKKDLASDYKISGDGLIYTFDLKQAVWSDGKKLTSDDVVFSFNAALSTNLRSHLKSLFEGIRVDRIDEDTLEFHLFQPYSGFLVNLTQLKIIPEHIWSALPFDSWSLSDAALEPITSGPYLVDKVIKNQNRATEYRLLANESYHLQKPHIEKIRVKIFDNPESLRVALLTKQIDATSDLPLEILNGLHKRSLVFEKYTQPSYFALFFNLQRSTGEKKIRSLIDATIDRNYIANEILAGYVEPLNNGPFAQKLLERQVPQSSSSTSTTTEFLQTPLKLILSTPNNDALKAVAATIAKDLSAKNINVSLKILNEQEIQTALTNKNFDVILFGENFYLSFDLFDLWHYNTPGNIVAYQNSTLDQLIEENRTTQSEEKLRENLLKINDILKKDAPAVFIFSPYVVYAHRSNLHLDKINPINSNVNYLSNIETWYFKTRRVLK